ncbi:hypothetical protein AB0K00_41855 [Dactylosporangium sp. NPDC049525]|uniref:hypothetical protein n=1 Tax=Dactylosporangium sp. NPDC049525 TaxID=3154730 RepID=UPI00344849FA
MDVHDPQVRRHMERVFAAAFCVRRAVQRDARARVGVYWAAHRERAAAGPAAVRDRLGLTRAGLEHAAYRHVEAAAHLRRHLTKAMAMHLADGVWRAVDRHLFPDASGCRHGLLRVGGRWEFGTIPGRARSHTRARKWETWRLVGSLAGHRAVFDRGGRLWQPRRMPAVTPNADGRPVRSWWDHYGALAVVLTGTGAQDLVLPVRLPQGPGRGPVLEHYLADPDHWHKVDVVRHRDPGAVGGWRYEAHLMILGSGHTSPAMAARRAAAAGLRRRGGVDVNVSNLAVVSVPIHPELPGDYKGNDGGLRATRIASTGPDADRLAVERLRQRRRNRALQRSRRSGNPTQYQLSARQQRRADRRHAAGLPAVQVPTPGGPRLANTAGVPVRSYRRDHLSNGYQRLRARAAAAGEARTMTGRTRARIIAADLVAVHGANLVVEAGDLRVWARRWGRGMYAFTPGMLVTALDHETTKTAAMAPWTGVPRGSGLVRAGTRHTAWTQHCLCGIRVPKTLCNRRHTCPGCGLAGDRDLVAALVGAHTVLTEPGTPSSARIDWTHAHATHTILGVDTINQGLQGALTESTGHHRPHQYSAGGRPQRSTQRSTRDGGCRRARRSTGTVLPTTPDETHTAPPCGTTPERRDAHPGLRHDCGRQTQSMKQVLGSL